MRGKKSTVNLQYLKGIALTVALSASVVVTQPIFTVDTIAAAIEDCDLDGYDDHTGNPVPWIGFDSTKGEELPAGWDGYTTYKSKKAFEEAQKKDTEEETTTKASGSSSSSDSCCDAPSEDTSGSGSTSGSSNSGSSKSSSSKSNSSKNKSSNSSSSKSSSSKSSSSKNSSTDKSSDSSNNGQTGVEAETNATENVEETTALDENNKDNKKIKKTKKSKKEATEETTEVVEETEPNDVNTVLDTKGTLEVTEANGSIIHAGSDLVIKGTGFAGNVNNISIEIHSDNPTVLTSVNTADDGSFEAQAYIPEDLPEGTHEIVVLFYGDEITRQTIEVGPKVADTFFKAFTVGFSAGNKGLIPGLLILAGLAIAGIATVFVGGLFGKKQGEINKS